MSVDICMIISKAEFMKNSLFKLTELMMNGLTSNLITKKQMFTPGDYNFFQNTVLKIMTEKWFLYRIIKQENLK